MKRPPINEKVFTASVIGLCHLKHLYVAHFRASRTSDGGWTTAVQGNGKGYPDLTILGPAGVMWRELKVGRNKLEPLQREWAERLAEAGADVGVWRPEHLDDGTIERELARIAKRSRPWAEI